MWRAIYLNNGKCITYPGYCRSVTNEIKYQRDHAKSVGQDSEYTPKNFCLHYSKIIEIWHECFPYIVQSNLDDVFSLCKKPINFLWSSFEVRSTCYKTDFPSIPLLSDYESNSTVAEKVALQRRITSISFLLWIRTVLLTFLRDKGDWLDAILCSILLLGLLVMRIWNPDKMGYSQRKPTIARGEQTERRKKSIDLHQKLFEKQHHVQRFNKVFFEKI